MSETSELWWVSVGGNPCEPARIVIRPGVKGGSRIIFTIGCGDGTFLADGCGIELIKKIDEARDNPTNVAQREAEWKAKRAADIKRGVYHGYRRFS